MTRVPSRSFYDPVLDSMMHTGARAIEAVVDLISATAPGSVMVATDIETPGLTRQFEINCVTASWRVGGQLHSILLDPDRTDGDDIALRDLYDHASAIVLHNAPFDIPGLHRSGHLTIDHIDKVLDTLVLARFAIPDTYVPKKLEALAKRLLDLDDFGGGMGLAFKSAGHMSQAAGYAHFDIGSPIYRQGAMGDTAVTLRLAELLWDRCLDWTLDHDFRDHGATSRSEAEEILMVPVRVHQVMLKRTARGIGVDLDYLDGYTDQVAAERDAAVALLAEHDLEGGTGKGPKIIEAIEAMGQLPDGWPRTPTGKLKATKDLLDDLDHPLARAQRELAETDKVLGYLDAVRMTGEVTGRCHPQCGVLGASATGRMCIPTTHGILTRRGVLAHDEVRIGDETIDMHGQWTRVTGLHRYPDQGTIIYRSRLTTLEATDEHRWVSRSESGGGWRVGPLELSQRRSVLLVPEGKYDITARTIDAQTDGETLAAVVGMLITDGRCTVNYAKGARGDMRAHIYQSTRKFYTEFRRVIPDEALMYDRVLDRPGDNENHEMRLKTRWLRPRLAKAGLDGAEHLTANPNLVSWVLGLSERECAAFLTAAYLGDGIADPAGGQRMIAQREQARHALMVAAYRLGVRCTRRSVPPTGWGTDDIEEICFQTAPHIHTRHMEIDKGRCDVWCVTTESGTFTAFSDTPYLTGNSYAAPPLQQFSANARPILVGDDDLWSIDWSQIEPVTMANMGHDLGFLAPFEAGDDLYEPIMLAAGIDRPLAKAMLLATMYGQGIGSLARRIGHTQESAQQIKRQMLSSMPKAARFMTQVTQIAEKYGRIVTVGGRVLPIDPQGTFKAVNYICIAPDTPVLTADLRHVPAKTIAVGDELVGFDEHRSEADGRGTGKRRFRTARVTEVHNLVKPSVIVSAGGRTTTCSVEHRWLVRCPDQNVRLQWVRADELIPGYHQMLSVGTWETDTSREAGYLAGLLDGEGYMGRRQLVFSQRPGAVMDTFTSTMDKLGLGYAYVNRAPNSTSSADNVRVSGGVPGIMRVIGTVRPERFVARSREVYEGVELHSMRQMENMPVVDAVTPVADAAVVSITTTTGTFIANGWLSHNCQGSAADVMNNAIIECDRAGLGDHIYLAMHDELVVGGGEDVAAEVEQIMLRPPERLTAWAGRTPILRTDRQNMGHSWKKV